MSAERFASADPDARIALALLRLAFRDSYARDFGITLWEGTRVEPARDSRFVLHVNSPGALRAVFASPIDLSAGRAFGLGLLDVEGDVEHAVDTFLHSSATVRLRDALRILRLSRRLPKERLDDMRQAKLRGRLHSRTRDRAAIGFH